MNRRETLLVLCALPMVVRAGVPDLKAVGGALKLGTQPATVSQFIPAVSNFVSKASPTAGGLLASVLK